MFPALTKMETAAESHATDVMGGSDTVQPATEDIPFDYEVNEDGESVGESLELSEYVDIQF